LVSSDALSIEHVGSTSVPGLAAKPVLDIDIVISNIDKLPPIIEKLKTLGYIHRGNLGLEGREAFQAPENLVSHHLYVCLEDSVAYKNHMILRDFLRINSAARDQYAQLKRDLADKYADSIDSYVDGKTDFILKILQQEGMQEKEISSVLVNKLEHKRK
jgi:GrpB-like predicted nucleotidyltransferase (UPF0157 family)